MLAVPATRLRVQPPETKSRATISVRGISLRSENHGLWRLTPRQLRIVELVSEGLKNREIAGALGRSEQSVKNELRAVYDKLGLSNRVELALWCAARKHEGHWQFNS